jgi:hypothetical protein
MGQIKSMLKRCEVETAERKRTCRRTGSAIAQGQKCLVIFDGPRDRHCYCSGVALEMIRASLARLQEIEKQIS